MTEIKEDLEIKEANLICLLDISGSMFDKWDTTTCRSVSSFVKEQKKTFKGTNSIISLISFNHKINILEEKKQLKYFNLDIKNIKPSGGTSIYDAILSTEKLFSNELLNFLIIITDGEDTSSKKSKKDALSYIEKCKEKSIEVIYLGINVELNEAKELGIDNTFESTYDNVDLQLTRRVSSLIRRKSFDPDYKMYDRQVSVPITYSEKKNIDKKVNLQKIKRLKLIKRQYANPDLLNKLSDSDIQDIPTKLPSF